MKHLPKSKSVRHINNDETVVYEYDAGSVLLDAAVIELSGRYPSDGQTCNTLSTVLIYVIEGSGKAIVEDNVVEVSEGDQMSIEKNEKYYFDGHFKMLYIATPKWTADQATHIKL